MRSEKLQLYASLAEIVSAVAIVVSLLYVVSEFRQTQTLSERDADAQLFERVSEANRMVIENPGVAAIVLAAAESPEDLSRVDRLRFLAYEHQSFDSWELAWGYHEDGVLGDRLWGEWNGWFTQRARGLPDFAWAEVRENFSGAFRNHVDRALGFANPGIPAATASDESAPSTTIP